jgi:hypothetical protein
MRILIQLLILGLFLGTALDSAMADVGPQPTMRINLDDTFPPDAEIDMVRCEDQECRNQNTKTSTGNEYASSYSLSCNIPRHYCSIDGHIPPRFILRAKIGGKTISSAPTNSERDFNATIVDGEIRISYLWTPDFSGVSWILLMLFH